MDTPERHSMRRRTILFAVSQIGIGVALSACAPARTDTTATASTGTTATSNPGNAPAPGGTPAPAATLAAAQSPVAAAAASPAASPRVSPSAVPAASPAASPVAAPDANQAPGPVSGAARLPVGAPTPGGPAPTLVGVNSGPAPQANASGAFVVQGAASPVAAPNAAAAVSPVPSPTAAGASATPQAAASVNITVDRRFDPAQVTVQRGQSVLWRNAGRSPQTVTFDPGRVSDASHVTLPAGAQPFDSGVINSAGTYTHTFDVAGEYQYVSLPYESQNMTGRVTVQG